MTDEETPQPAASTGPTGSDSDLEPSEEYPRWEPTGTDEEYARFDPFLAVQTGQASLEAENEANRKQDIAVLKARAADLARIRRDESVGLSRAEYLEFLLAGERYAISIGQVREAFPLKDLTPLPGVPRFVLGIANVRGRILTMLDLGSFLGLPPRDLAGGAVSRVRALIVGDREIEVGLVADEIAGIVRLAEDAILPRPVGVTGPEEALILGVTPDRIIVLDVPKVLGDLRKRLLQE